MPTENQDLLLRAALEGDGAVSKRLDAVAKQRGAAADDPAPSKDEPADKKKADAQNDDLAEIKALLVALLKRQSQGEGEVGEEHGEGEGEADDEEDRDRGDGRGKSAPRQLAADDDDANELAHLQQRADSIATTNGIDVIRPKIGERAHDFRGRSAKYFRGVLRADHGLRHADPLHIRDRAAFRKVTDDIFDAAERAPYDATTVPAGRLREVTETDRTGRKITKFVGPIEAMLDQFRFPAMCVRKWGYDQHGRPQ